MLTSITDQRFGLKMCSKILKNNHILTNNKDFYMFRYENNIRNYLSFLIISDTPKNNTPKMYTITINLKYNNILLERTDARESYKILTDKEPKTLRTFLENKSWAR